MKEALIKAITGKVGKIDADNLITVLDTLGVTDLEVTDKGLKIPADNIDERILRECLSSLSKVGRTFELTKEADNSLLIDTLTIAKSYLNSRSKNRQPDSNTRQNGSISTTFFASTKANLSIHEGECKHFQYGNFWVANRNVLFMPDGSLKVLNNPNHLNNTIEVTDIKEHLSLKFHKQIGDLRFKLENEKLIVEYKLDPEEEMKFSHLRPAIEERAKNEIALVLEHGYGAEISNDDFYHGHPFMDPDNPQDIYILYHTYETSKPSLEAIHLNNFKIK